MDTVRRNSCVVLRAVEVTAKGEVRTTLYGPFLPHVGSAATSMMADLRTAADDRGTQAFEVYAEDVFIGEDESDCRIEATR